jgi:16S rRNA (cytosine1402-N4)-methyltransferase
VDCTLGFGGHARAILERIGPGGRLLALDQDPLELPRAAARLRDAGFGADVFEAHRTNFAGLARVVAGASADGVDLVLADLGVSSMQIDNPARGFTFKEAAPLDMRMNPSRGVSASDWLRRTAAPALAAVLTAHADEPHAEAIAACLAGQAFTTTHDLAEAVRAAVVAARPRMTAEDRERAVRRVFQAVRIAVNDEFGALDALLRALPLVLRPGGRVAILTFHSGEDRRVKKAFQAGGRDGVYADLSTDPMRASAAEIRANPRASSAKLRWARRA